MWRNPVGLGASGPRVPSAFTRVTACRSAPTCPRAAGSIRRSTIGRRWRRVAQVFTQSPRMWRPTSHDPANIERFKERRGDGARLGHLPCDLPRQPGRPTTSSTKVGSARDDGRRRVLDQRGRRRVPCGLTPGEPASTPGSSGRCANRARSSGARTRHGSCSRTRPARADDRLPDRRARGAVRGRRPPEARTLPRSCHLWVSGGT